MFTTDEADFFDEMLEGSFDGSMEGHQWLVVQYDARRVQAVPSQPLLSQSTH